MEAFATANALADLVQPSAHADQESKDDKLSHRFSNSLSLVNRDGATLPVAVAGRREHPSRRPRDAAGMVPGRNAPTRDRRY